MSILEELVTSCLGTARPGPVETHGDRVVGTLLLGRSAWHFNERNDLISLITSAQAVLRGMDDAIWRRDNGQPSVQAEHQPSLGRPYTAAAPGPATVPTAADTVHGDLPRLDETPLLVGPGEGRRGGAHAAPTGQGSQVVPNPPRAAVAP